MRIEAASMDQLEAIGEGLPERPRALHARRISQQDQDHSLYLLAWKREGPVGHVVVKWPAWPESPFAVEWQARYGCSMVEDLWICPDSRGKGIGRALMETAHARTGQRGIGSVGLGVGVGDGYDAARHLYKSLGYRDRGHGRFIESSPGWWDILVFLLKELGP